MNKELKEVESMTKENAVNEVKAFALNRLLLTKQY